MDKTIKILKRSTWKYRVLHNTCTKHGRNIRIRCIGSTSTLLQRKGWSSISNTIERYHSSRNTPSLLYPENCSDGNWKNQIRENTCVTSSLHPKISLNHDQMKELGSEVVRQPEGEVVQQSKSSQSSQPNPNPDQDRTGKHVVCPQRRASRSQEIETRSFREEAVKHDRTEKPVVCRDENHEHSMLNEDDIDFRIPRLPHSVAKQADNYRVRELVKQIENNPHRQALQHDLQQNNAYNPFSDKSKKMIMDMGYVELFELFDTDPKTQCKECLLYWSEGIVYCTCEHLLKERAANRGVIQKNWTFSQFQTTWLRKDDLMATDMGKLHKRQNIIKPIIWKRDASRKVFRRSTIAFRSIPNFVHPSSNMIEMNKSVSKWMILRTTISPTTWRRMFSIQTELMDLSQ